MASLSKKPITQSSPVIADGGGANEEVLIGLFDNGSDAQADYNFEIARELNKNKKRLAGVLSEFPISALWLCSRYDQQIGAAEEFGQDDDDGRDFSESTSDLSALQNIFLKASNAFRVKDKHYFEHKRTLANALKEVRYSFQDLRGLVNVIVFAYKLRRLNFQTGAVDYKINSNLVMKRL